MITSVFLIEDINNVRKLNSHALVIESFKRGHNVYATRAESLTQKNNKLYAECFAVNWVDDGSENGKISESLEAVELCLNDVDYINIRLNPPFNMMYFTAMSLLATIEGNGKPLIANSPSAINAMPEKILPPEMLKFMPESMITGSLKEIKEFLTKHKDIILKPLYDFGGNGIFRVKEGDNNLGSIFAILMSNFGTQIVVQKYLPEIKQGDKRILLFNGDVIGQYLRVPPEGQLQAAIGMGGSFVPSALTEIEKQMCETLSPILKKSKIYLCGIDVIGNHLTEINVTCPSGHFEIKKLYEIDAPRLYWEMLEQQK